ncbi:MAG: hypothetical protein V3V56_09675 [bacterium]
MGAASSLESSATQAREILREIFSSLHDGFKIRLWDESEISLGLEVHPVTIIIHSPRALKRILLNPTAAEFGEAYCDGDIDFSGDLFEVMQVGNSMEEIDLSFWDRVKIGLRVKRIPE